MVAARRDRDGGELGGVGSRTLPPIDHGRLLQAGEAFWDESPGPGYRGGRLISRIRTFKVARRMDQTVFAYTTTPLAMAESMAFNVDCLGCLCWYEFGKIVSRPYSDEPVSEELLPFVRFFHSRRDLFREAAVVADVAVLRSFPSQVFADPKHAEFTARVEQTLIENRGCFQIIYDHHLDDLTRYRVLILAGCVALSDPQIDQIREYVESGGQVLVIGPLATHDEWMVSRKEPGLGDLSADRVVRISESGDLVDAIRRACGGKLSLSIEAEAPKPEMPWAAVGETVYADRDYLITQMPEELAGARTIRFPVKAAKLDSSLRFRARVPVRVFVAFAPKGFSSQWLDPQPHWKMYKTRGLDTTVGQIGKGMDVYCRDFDAGDVTLFEGEKGAYVLLGIKAQARGFEGEAFVVQPAGDAAAGLCAELTEQPGRRLVHLVNYRPEGPMKNVRVCLRVPEGRRVTSVAGCSPQQEGDLVLPFEQEAEVVTFTVPEVGIYEIAVVATE